MLLHLDWEEKETNYRKNQESEKGFFPLNPIFKHFNSCLFLFQSNSETCSITSNLAGIILSMQFRFSWSSLKITKMRSSGVCISSLSPFSEKGWGWQGHFLLKDRKTATGALDSWDKIQESRTVWRGLAQKQVELDPKRSEIKAGWPPTGDGSLPGADKAQL